MTGIVKILDWRPLRKNSLLGFAKIELPSGMVISDVTILTGDAVRGRRHRQSQ